MVSNSHVREFPHFLSLDLLVGVGSTTVALGGTEMETASLAQEVQHNPVQGKQPSTHLQQGKPKLLVSGPVADIAPNCHTAIEALDIPKVAAPDTVNT